MKSDEHNAGKHFEYVVGTDEDLKLLQNLAISAEGCAYIIWEDGSTHMYDFTGILYRLEAAEKVAKVASKLADCVTRMAKDHHDKLIANQTLESASDNWDTLLQEPLEFGPLIESLTEWRKECGKE